MDFQEVMMFLQSLPTKKWGEKEITLLLSEAYVFLYLDKGNTTSTNPLVLSCIGTYGKVSSAILQPIYETDRAQGTHLVHCNYEVSITTVVRMTCKEYL